MREGKYTFRKGKTVENRPSDWIQAIAAHLLPGKMCALYDGSPQPPLSTEGSATCTGGTSANDHDIEIVCGTRHPEMMLMLRPKNGVSPELHECRGDRISNEPATSRKSQHFPGTGDKPFCFHLLYIANPRGEKVALHTAICS